MTHKVGDLVFYVKNGILDKSVIYEIVYVDDQHDRIRVKKDKSGYILGSWLPSTCFIKCDIPKLKDWI